MAVPPTVAALGGGTGHGNMWRHVLEGLAQVAEIETRERPTRRIRFGKQPDVWLADGHAPPPQTGGAPLVVQVHEAGWADPELAKLLHPEFARAMAASTEAAIEAATAVIVPSEASRAQVAAAYGVDPVAVHHGVDLDVFRPDAGTGADRGAAADPRAGADPRAPDPRAADPGAPYILFVGVIHPRKNLDGLRAAIALLADDGLPYHLGIVGRPARDRPDPTALIEAARAELPGHPGRVHMLEAPTDAGLAAIYANAAAFCLPSFFEGFGLPALEALACGTPVVVSDRGALPEVVGDAGVATGVDPESIATALVRAIRGPDAGGRARAETMPWSKTVEGWHRVLRDAAGF